MSSMSTFIAIRYLQSNRENRFFSWIAILSICGIAIGVATMIVVLSVINGFEFELRHRFLLANAHILAYKFPNGLEAPERWEEIIMSDFKGEVTGVAPFIHYETLARKGTFNHAVLVRGIDPEARAKVQSIREIVQPPTALDELQAEISARANGGKEPTVPAAIVGSGLLTLLDAKVGEDIELISPDPDKLGDVNRFRIAGVYDSGLKHYDNKLILLSLSTAQTFFKMGKRVIGMEIGLARPETSPNVAERMSKKYNISIREWQSFNRPLFEAMEMERAVIALIVALVAFVASFNILTTLFVSVSQKQRDISILKALGASHRQIRRLFISQSMLIGLAGSSFGILLALVVSRILEEYQFVQLPDLYYLAKLPMTYDWRVYLGISLSGVCICVIAGLYPAIIASHVVPTKGFQGTEQQ